MDVALRAGRRRVMCSQVAPPRATGPERPVPGRRPLPRIVPFQGTRSWWPASTPCPSLHSPRVRPTRPGTSYWDNTLLVDLP